MLFLALAGVEYRHRDLADYDPELVGRSALTTYVVLSMGLIYVGLGFAEASLLEVPKARRVIRRAERPRRRRRDHDSLE